MDSPASRSETRPADGRGGITGRPWVWLLLVGTLFSLPLIKSGTNELPPVPPGIDGESLEFHLPDETGTEIALADLAGHLLVITDLPLANGTATEATFEGIIALRKRLRGLGSAVVYVVLCHGGSAAELSALLDEKRARKPVNLFLLDEGRGTAAWLRRTAGSESAAFFLLDTHRRLRGVYPGTQRGVDELVHLAGMLANWPEADPAPAG